MSQEDVEGLKKRVLLRRWVAFPLSRAQALGIFKMAGPLVLRLLEERSSASIV